MTKPDFRSTATYALMLRYATWMMIAAGTAAIGVIFFSIARPTLADGGHNLWALWVLGLIALGFLAAYTRVIHYLRRFLRASREDKNRYLAAGQLPTR